MADDQQVLIERLKDQRDRFIAFAFAGADLLVEMAEDGRIGYSAGAAESLNGLADAKLIGRNMADLVHSGDRPVFDSAIQRLRNTGRLDHTELTVVGDSGIVTRMRLAGIRLPQFDCFHLALSRVAHLVTPARPSREREADPKTRFVEVVRHRLNEANRAGRDVTLTLIDMKDTPFDKFERAAAETLLSSVYHALQEMSVEGASAGALTDRAFGIVHSQSTPPDEVRARVAEIAQRMGSKAAGMRLRAASLELEDEKLSDTEIDNGLNHIVNAFVRDSANFAIPSLAEGARVATDDTLRRVGNFRKLVKADRMVFLFQPAVNLRTGKVLTFEAYVRLNQNGTLFTPTQILPFAADTGVMGEFDAAAVRSVLKMMRDPGLVSPLASVTVNLSSQSLFHPLFFKTLLAVLAENKPLLGRLILEITDAREIGNLADARRHLQRLRGLGVRISLDDFGTSGAAIDLLRALPINFAKIDPGTVREASDPKGMACLKALATLCSDLGVVTIAESVEDSAAIPLIRQAGIDYIQGYLLGRPDGEIIRKSRTYVDEVKRLGTYDPVLSGG